MAAKLATVIILLTSQPNVWYNLCDGQDCTRDYHAVEFTEKDASNFAKLLENIRESDNAKE